jgi:hypothetical protein
VSGAPVSDRCTDRSLCPPFPPATTRVARVALFRFRKTAGNVRVDLILSLRLFGGKNLGFQNRINRCYCTQYSRWGHRIMLLPCRSFGVLEARCAGSLHQRLQRIIRSVVRGPTYFHLTHLIRWLLSSSSSNSVAAFPHIMRGGDAKN